MPYMLCRHKVEDFIKWKAIFDSHTDAHKQAGMNLKHIWQKEDDPNDIFFLFQIRSIQEAQDFMNLPEMPRVKEEAGVIGQPEVYFLK